MRIFFRTFRILFETPEVKKTFSRLIRSQPILSIKADEVVEAPCFSKYHHGITICHQRDPPSRCVARI